MKAVQNSPAAEIPRAAGLGPYVTDGLPHRGCAFSSHSPHYRRGGGMVVDRWAAPAGRRQRVAILVFSRCRCLSRISGAIFAVAWEPRVSQMAAAWA